MSLVARPASLGADKVVSDPFADKVVYDDALVSRVLIEFITMKISDEVGAVALFSRFPAVAVVQGIELRASSLQLILSMCSC